jgi:hypothetical protein
MTLVTHIKTHGCNIGLCRLAVTAWASDNLENLLLQQLTELPLLCVQLRVAVVGGGTGEVLAAAGITPEFTATKVRHDVQRFNVGPVVRVRCFRCAAAGMTPSSLSRRCIRVSSSSSSSSRHHTRVHCHQGAATVFQKAVLHITTG